MNLKEKDFLMIVPACCDLYITIDFIRSMCLKLRKQFRITASIAAIISRTCISRLPSVVAVGCLKKNIFVIDVGVFWFI